MSKITDRLNAALKGRYRIVDELGEGGMATVYLAEDVKHKRQVALKVLRPELAAVVGAERFLAEIETTANLQHPHILPLFDSGEADSFLFYVMPYVEGESLRDLLDREKQLPVDQAVEITRKVAAALQHAHDRGVVHRDIKPANILMSDGEPLVADFGIALAVNSAGGGRITETGLSLGTPHYMSPEQASGDRSLDPRSDIYALGCVLYECLAGEPPFPGPTPQAVLARILTAHAQPVTGTRPTVPPNVEAAVARALEKLPADRFESVADFRKALDDPGFRHSRARPLAAEPQSTEARANIKVWWSVAAAFAILLALTAWGWLRPAASAPFRTMEIVLDSAGYEFGPAVAVSPSGQSLAYVTGGSGIAVRSMASTDLRFLPIDDLARTPFFAPDGSGLGYHAGSPGNSKLLWQRVDGGGEIQVAEDVYPGATWAEDGDIYFSRESDRSIWRVRAQGGDPERVPQPDSIEFGFPHALPGGRLLVIANAPDDDGDNLGVLDLQTGEFVRFEGAGLAGTGGARFAGGYLFWVDNQRNLLAAHADVEAARLTSPAVNLATQVIPVAGGNLSVADDGTLIFMTGLSAQSGLGENLAWVNRGGGTEVIEERLAEQLSDFDGLALGPNERYVAAQVDAPGGRGDGDADIWIFDTRQSTVYPLTFDGRSFDPEWLDSERVAYLRPTDGGGTAVLAQPWDRSGPETTVLESDREIEDMEAAPGESPLLLVLADADDPATPGGLYTVEADDPASLQPLVATAFQEGEPDISPDGRWVAYVSDETGRPEIYVRSFPGGGRPWPISTDGGTTPRWGPDSDELYFVSTGRLVLATLDFSEGVDVAQLTELFSTQPFEMSGYQPSKDGERLIMIREAVGSDVGSPMLMLNVFDEIERRLAQ